jgi:hypothetical protein
MNQLTTSNANLNNNNPNMRPSTMTTSVDNLPPGMANPTLGNQAVINYQRMDPSAISQSMDIQHQQQLFKNSFSLAAS